MTFVRILTAALCTLLLAGTAWSTDDLQKKAAALFKPLPSQAPALSGNPATSEKVELGKMLYFDPRLSRSALISCNTCHNLGLGGDDDQESSVGHAWQKGHRNAPTVLNSVFNIAQFWDGRAPDLREQAKGPVQASVEMNNTPEMTVQVLKSMPGYVILFQQAFPGESDPVTFDNMARAIEVFEATLITPDSPFDRFLKGDTRALGAQEQKGLGLFIEKGCVGCHGGMNLGGQGYFPFGLVERPSDQIMAGDKGRFAVTGTQSDEYVFKSPSLRNIALTAPYFHSGRVWALREAVAIMGSSQLGIELSTEEADLITVFLQSTNGVLPKIVYPVLPSSTESTPKPKLD